jgi:hypothetical protein
MYRALLALLFAAALFSAPLAAQEPFPQELTGLWIARGPSIETSYSYGPDGGYAIDAVPPLEERGRASVVERAGRRYRVRFERRVRMNDRKRPLEVWVELSEDGRSFVIGGRTYDKKA